MRPRSARAFVCLCLCTILLIVRLSGVHTHLCFDGLDPPSAQQSSASDLANEIEHALHGHSIHDACVSTDANHAPTPPDLDHPLLAAVLLALLPAFARAVPALQVAPQVSIRACRRFVFPPTRAPPQLWS